MKNKKSLAMAMAAVSTLGAVAPAFADGVQGRAVITANAATIDARLASGYKIYEEKDAQNQNQTKQVFKRAEIFNYNGAEKDRDKHTLKSKYANYAILAQKLDDQDPAKDVFVLGTKAAETDVKLEKSRIEVLKEEVAQLVKEGYKVTETTLDTDKAKIENDVYTAGTRTFTLTKTGATDITITVNNVDGIEVADKTEEEKETAKTEELRKSVFGENAKTDESFDFANDVYADVNLLKYQIESNIDKFDIVKDEAGDKNQNIAVTLYRKGATNQKYAKVMTITFENTKKVDNKKIVTIPQTTDFAGHWAKDQIVNAMLNGKVDVAENFRPQDGITRAEFAKIVCTMFDITPSKDDSEPFHDVSKADGWKYDYIAALYTQGADGKIKVIQGSDDNFRPDDQITRQEVAVILAKMIAQVDKETPVDLGNGQTTDKTVESKKFKDTKDIDAWADESVIYLSEHDEAIYEGSKATNDAKYVVEGNEGKFNPKQNITRAEALVMIERAAIAESKITRP